MENSGESKETQFGLRDTGMDHKVNLPPHHK